MPFQEVDDDDNNEIWSTVVAGVPLDEQAPFHPHNGSANNVASKPEEASSSQDVSSFIQEDGEDEDDDDMEDVEDLIANNMLLLHYCSRASPHQNASSLEAIAKAQDRWAQVRDWIWNHPTQVVRQAAEQRGEYNLTPLHLCCRYGAPNDIIDVLMNVAPDTATWTDDFGWLPIHYACACEADATVIKHLADMYPESKIMAEQRGGKTPLHLIFSSARKTTDRSLVANLSSTGAAAFVDEKGMFPLHYACLLGTSEDCFLLLIQRNPDAIAAMDNLGLTPLHFVLRNASRTLSPGLARQLLRIEPRLANGLPGCPHPVRILAECSQNLSSRPSAEQRENVQKCLEHVLNADPDSTAEFLMALQSLPHWLSERAVLMPRIQNMLNNKISMRFPTLVLLLDLYILCIIIAFYIINVTESIRRRTSNNDNDDSINRGVPTGQLMPLYLGVFYFIVREASEVASVLALKAFSIWLRSRTHWLNLAFIILVLFWTIVMQAGAIRDDAFRTGTTLSSLVIWLKLLAFLRNLLMDFCVFVGGVYYVLQRLVAFLVCLGIILVAFSQMFVTVFQDSEQCVADTTDTASSSCPGGSLTSSYCDYWTGFLAVYTMLLGEVDEMDFESSTFATILFVAFFFLVVILLANVLIAIVTDSYRVIQKRRAAVFFWRNRLNFVAQMVAMLSRGKQLLRSLGCARDDDHDRGTSEAHVFGAELWTSIMDLFEEELDWKNNVRSIDFWSIIMMRLVSAVVIIPAWIAVGIASAGWLWPPQVRVAILNSTVSRYSSESEKQDELRKTQVANLQEEVEDLRERFELELAVVRTEGAQLRSSITDRGAEIETEMRHIKRIMGLLIFEQQPPGPYA